MSRSKSGGYLRVLVTDWPGMIVPKGSVFGSLSAAGLQHQYSWASVMGWLLLLTTVAVMSAVRPLFLTGVKGEDGHNYPHFLIREGFVHGSER